MLLSHTFYACLFTKGDKSTNVILKNYRIHVFITSYNGQMQKLSHSAKKRYYSCTCWNLKF